MPEQYFARLTLELTDAYVVGAPAVNLVDGFVPKGWTLRIITQLDEDGDDITPRVLFSFNGVNHAGELESGTVAEVVRHPDRGQRIWFRLADVAGPEEVEISVAACAAGDGEE